GAGPRRRRCAPPPTRQWPAPGGAGGGADGPAGAGAGSGGGPPARSPAMSQLDVGVIGDPAPWMSAPAIKPKSLAAILAEPPAGVQDRWFARLYLLKPLAIVSLALFWIATGLIPPGPARAASLAQLHHAGVHGLAADLILVGRALIDIVLGCALV